MEDELDDIAWELGCPTKTFIERRRMAHESTVSMWCNHCHQWKTHTDNPICLSCENEKLAIQNDELKRALELIQQKG